ncbi:NAD-dependent succinate-semialdehyde dehydrogenase [Donghicola eburneus]|uniref:Succinate-semialdehyde dehydrogenase [NADP(+)] GabD n=1 Tax=Donghicola eburneus TaxID=393278 RepID=A0A1M4MXN0_9RHOB|nr:NAD-dependent succinate-semialdehyde dehydrogenase [Donghicola eburneus]SCM67333.1 Succinate-semialdehyde dehydrogenase [NADP(+)] GabD [Donghicola eburneus]SFQ02150.1 succinate semialdehyde dehydrogenase [Donghicola eburneus]
MTEMSKRLTPWITDAALLRGNGDFAGQGRLAVRDPATGDLVAQVALSDAIGARAAVDAADEAFGDWAGMLPQDRASLLHRWHDLILDAKEDLAQIMVAEQGKPISEARGEIDYAASFVRFYAEEALRPNIEGVTSHLPDAEMELWREPVGVAALITPWNFPSAMITRKAAAALAAGCTVIIHPSAETPLSALALAELARRAGFPEGVMSTVVGDAATIVGEWTADARVRALSFTGSTEVGKLLYRQSADTVKRLVLELGGHAPFIVFDDADLDRAVTEAVKAKFATSGQDCLGANRIYVQREVYAEFCARFTQAVQALSMGSGQNDPDIGPLINEKAIQKQVEQVTDALANGAKVLTGGAVDESLGPLFFQPTVLADVPDTAAIMSQENFGPVAPITAFDTEEEAIQRANATEYGLVAYVHSLDPRRIYRLTRALQFGMVAVNRTKVTGAPIPFGGVKQSGLGREGARQGLEAFTDIKYVCRDWG